MVSVGNIVVSIVELVILFSILIFISWIISKRINKKFLVVFVCSWLLILLFNFIMTITNIPFIIGLPNETSMNGKDGKYISFGYAIKIEGHNAFEKSNYNVYFTNIF